MTPTLDDAAAPCAASWRRRRSRPAGRSVVVTRTGPPDADDVRAIARQLKRRETAAAPSGYRISPSARHVEQAQAAMKLESGASAGADGCRPGGARVGHPRAGAGAGRRGARIEAIDSTRHPGSFLAHSVERPRTAARARRRCGGAVLARPRHRRGRAGARHRLADSPRPGRHQPARDLSRQRAAANARPAVHGRGAQDGFRGESTSRSTMGRRA